MDSFFTGLRRGLRALVFGGEEMEELFREGGQRRYTVSDGILPSRPVPSTSTIHLPPYIISPFDRRYRVWQTFLTLLVVYSAWVSPFEMSFLNELPRPLFVVDIVVSVFFAVDIVLTFFIAYIDTSTYFLVDNHKKIGLKYAKSWLILDVISTLPWTEFVRYISTKHSRLCGLLSMLRLWRLRRVCSLFSRLEMDRNLNYIWVRSLWLFFVMIFAVHCGGCFNYLLAVLSDDPKSTWIGLAISDFIHQSLWIRYVASVYWSTTTLTTVGYGDLHAVNIAEMIFGTCYMLFNVALMAYLVGNISNLVVHATSKTRHFRDTIQGTANFARRNRLPPLLREEMMSHLCLQYRTDSGGLQQQEIIDKFPRAIKSSISYSIYYSLVEKVYLFRGTSNDMLFQLISKMRAEYFAPREDIILQNEAPIDLYIIASGEVDLLALKKGVEQVVGEAKYGDVCGEIGVLCKRPQLFTVRAKKLTQLLRLSKTSFFKLLEANIADWTSIMHNLVQHLKLSKDPIMEGILVEMQDMLVRKRIELPLPLCFAALNDDDMLLRNFLGEKTDPNESGDNRRTALHIAASKGNEECARILLEFGADANSTDSEGSFPLLEAIYGKHKAVVKLLLNGGARINMPDKNGRTVIELAEQQDNDIKELIKSHQARIETDVLDNQIMERIQSCRRFLDQQLCPPVVHKDLRRTKSARHLPSFSLSP